VKVLIVDDAPQIRSRFVALLSAIPGVRKVLQAEAADDAIATLTAHAPGVVVLDVHLRAGSGLALVPEVRRLCPGSVVVVVTNHATEQHRLRCMAAGVDAFLDKSREFDAVSGIVASAVATARRS
jgi:DNA-binding NarL/FixJ family response regulator